MRINFFLDQAHNILLKRAVMEDKGVSTKQGEWLVDLVTTTLDKRFENEISPAPSDGTEDCDS